MTNLFLMLHLITAQVRYPPFDLYQMNCHNEYGYLGKKKSR